MFIIGDSHSRNMYITLVSMLNEKYTSQNFIGAAIQFQSGLGGRNICIGAYNFYHAEVCREAFDVDYFDREGNFSIHWKCIWGGNGFDVSDIGSDDYWVWTQGMHQGYSHFFALSSTEKLNKISPRGTFVTDSLKS